MKSILMSTVSLSMSHINGTASIIVPVWYAILYGMTSLIWPAIAIWSLIR
jgi:hypothetical protein